MSDTLIYAHKENEAKRPVNGASPSDDRAITSKEEYEERQRERFDLIKQDRIREYQEEIKGQAFLRPSYYELARRHKLLIGVNIGLLSFFIALYVLSFVPQLKPIIFGPLGGII